MVSYVRQQTTNSLSFTVNDFFSDAISRGFAQRAWYLTSIQAGFEPWVGQTGLAVNSFSVTTGGGTTDTQAPTTPGTPSASGITGSSVNLNWSGSSDNVGVAGYDIFRATGASGGTFASVGSSSGTSFTNTGLTAATTYRYQVRARDAAGNTSAFSAPVTVTTSNGGGGGGACTASYRQTNAWSGGFQGEITVTAGAAAINGWTATLGFPAGVSITQMWNGTFTASGTTVTVHNMSYNGSLSAGGTTTFGFTANANGSNGATPTLGCTSP